MGTQTIEKLGTGSRNVDPWSTISLVCLTEPGPLTSLGEKQVDPELS